LAATWTQRFPAETFKVFDHAALASALRTAFEHANRDGIGCRWRRLT
jgi:hypothetical protein